MPKELLSSPKFRSFRTVKVGVVRGGASAERRISLRSGRAVADALRRIGVPVVEIDPRDRPAFRKKVRGTDVLFLALHGNGGEDGSLQKKLEDWKVPFTGSGSEACARSFNKLITKKHLERIGVPTPAYDVISKKGWWKKAAAFPVPFFVKPLDGGSSQGVFLVEDFRKSAEKLRRSVASHGRLLIEQKIFGRELTAGILAGRRLPVVEVRPKRNFYDYKAKYTKGMTVYEVPARIPAAVAKKVQSWAWRVFKGLGLSSFARIDVMLDRRQRPFVLEVNSIPGLTELSLLPKAARAAGIGFEELCLRALSEAIKRKNPRKGRALSRSKGSDGGA